MSCYDTKLLLLLRIYLWRSEEFGRDIYDMSIDRIRPLPVSVRVKVDYCKPRDHLGIWVNHKDPVLKHYASPLRASKLSR